MCRRRLMLRVLARAILNSSVTNLRQKLMTAPKRIFNGIWHMFVVTLGRISYAPPPDSISPENQVRIEQICGASSPSVLTRLDSSIQYGTLTPCICFRTADLAKDVLELVVDGPELESIWAAFHVDDNVQAPKTQAGGYEDESEADMLHVDLDD